jgi:type VI secretion system secreted protein Hcp
MRLMLSRRALRIALPTVAALGAGAAVGVAAIPSADGTIHSCVTTSNGAIRIIDAEATPAQACTGTETALNWNQQGPAGPTGPPGPQGDPGTSGSSGSSSPDTSFSTPSQAGGPSADMFLKVDGMPGDSTDDEHKNEINVTSFAFAVGRGGDGTGIAAPTAATAGGTGTSRRGLQTLRIDKIYDAASPKLMRAAANGQHIKSAVLTFHRSSDDDTVDFVTYTLNDVVVTSYDQGGTDGDRRDLGSLEEEVGLTAARVRVSEQTVDEDGKKGPVVSAEMTVPKTK